MEQTAEQQRRAPYSHPMLQLEAPAREQSVALSPPAPPGALAPAAKLKPITGLRKAAVLLIAIGEEASGKVVKDLSDDEVHTISKSIMTSEPVTSEEASAVLRE